MGDTLPASTIDSQTALRGLYKMPGEVASKKVLSQLDEHCRQFIKLSPFLCISTAGADGSADVSPRGDAPKQDTSSCLACAYRAQAPPARGW